jgi:hypothetical protein
MAHKYYQTLMADGYCQVVVVVELDSLLLRLQQVVMVVEVDLVAVAVVAVGQSQGKQQVLVDLAEQGL